MTPTSFRTPAVMSMLAGVALLASACTSTPAQPTAAPAVATAAGVPAQASPATVTSPSPVASPSAVSGSPAAKPGGPPPSQSPVAVASPGAVAVPAGGVGFTIVPADSEARFIARELLAANTVKNDAIGKTKDVMGSIVFDSTGKVVAGSKIVVNVQTLASDRDQRDGFIKRGVLETAQFPTAEFVPTEIQGMTGSVPTSGQATVKMIGNLTVHGVTKPATWDTTVAFGASDVTGKATTSVTLPDFGMTKPSVPVVAEIEDTIRLELDFKATRSS